MKTLRKNSKILKNFDPSEWTATCSELSNDFNGETVPAQWVREEIDRYDFSKCQISEDGKHIHVRLHSNCWYDLHLVEKVEGGAKFEVGETYSTRSACDYDCVFSYTVVSRTKKQMVIESHGETQRRGIKTDEDGNEWCQPEGSYSMAPIIRAEKTGDERDPEPAEEVPAESPQDTTPAPVDNGTAPDPELVVRKLIDAGFTPQQLSAWSVQRVLTEYEAIERRAMFMVV